MKVKIDEFANKIITDLRWGGVSDFKKNYQPRTNIVKMRRVIWLQTATVSG